MACPNKQQNLEMCNCTYSGCDKKGKCCECMHFHRQRGELPACFFPDDVERTCDRSVERFKSL
ncbi:hypothetical protein KY328_03455 [Candidatus Woesearchaeota archaeon]|nr:hypothetical protein [Candidatus Woesearchaeota archaeon]